MIISNLKHNIPIHKYHILHLTQISFQKGTMHVIDYNNTNTEVVLQQNKLCITQFHMTRDDMSFNSYLTLLVLVMKDIELYKFIKFVFEGHRSWWRHQMETFSALLALCAGNSPVPVNSSHKGQWRGTLMFSLICARINDWVNNREAGDLRRHRGHYDVNVM